MSEKPALFPEESEAARIAPATPPPWKKKKLLHGHQSESLKARERERNCATERMRRGVWVNELRLEKKGSFRVLSFPHMGLLPQARGKGRERYRNRWSNAVTQLHLFQPMSEWELFNHSCYNLFLCKEETWIALRLPGNPGSTDISYCATAGWSHRPTGTCRDDTALVKGINTVPKVRKI